MPLGVHSLDARIQLARRAQHSLVVQHDQFENDATGRLLLRAVREAAMRGVPARILVNDLYTTHRQQRLAAMAQTPNVEVRLFNPFWMFGKSLGRLHSTTAAIDRQKIFVDSMNLDPRCATQNTKWASWSTARSWPARCSGSSASANCKTRTACGWHEAPIHLNG